MGSILNSQTQYCGRMVAIILALLMAVILCVVSSTSANAAAEKQYPELPTELDGKGLFIQPENKIKKLKVKNVVTSDWLYKKNGAITDRKRKAYVEYNESGKFIKFSGHRDQLGFLEMEFVYDSDGNISEEKHFVGRGNSNKPRIRRVYDYSKPKIKERTSYSSDGEMLNRRRYLYDDAGNNIELQGLDITSGIVLGALKMKYDRFGNLLEKGNSDGRDTYSYDKNVITVSRYIGPKSLFSKGRLLSTREFTFDSNGNLKQYYRRSGDGKYWDKFTYKLDDHGLPEERVWSRYEFILQDPYELTKYHYEYFK